MKYAFDEFYRLLDTLRHPISDNNPVVKYLCALVSELAYYHVPQFEIDDHKRTKVVPCDVHNDIVSFRRATNIEQFLQDFDFPNSFVIEDRGLIVVGLFAKEYLFVGFRGTAFLYDWKINLRASLVDVTSEEFYRPLPTQFSGKVHKGFFEETMRMAVRLSDEMVQQQGRKVSHILFTGHSLGGAVAALTQKLWLFPTTSAWIFGTPRYCDSTFHLSCKGKPPVHSVRSQDIVPSVPPKILGYADHPTSFHTNGVPVVSSIRSSGWPYFIWRMSLFLGKRLEPHSMEGYRQQIGLVAGASGCNARLLPLDKLVVKVGISR